MDDSEARQLQAVVAGVLRTLDDVVAVYHFGSAVMGGLHTFSDLDILVVVSHPTTADQRRRLLAEIMPVSGSLGTRIPGRPLEVTVVRQGMVRPWGSHPEREFQYGEWLRADCEAGSIPKPEPDPDLFPLLSTVLTGSVALHGPPAAAVIDPVPGEALVAALRSKARPLLADLDTDATNVLLTLARMWYTKDTGAITSKDEAASWAIDRLPPPLRPPLAQARSVYLGQADASFHPSPAIAAPTARYLVTTIAGRVSRAAPS